MDTEVTIQKEAKVERDKNNFPEMDKEFDVIILGTGLIECILSATLSLYEYKVLQIDRNPYYGNESTSLSLDQIYEKFGRGKPPSNIGPSREYSIDTIFKLILSQGEFVKIIMSFGVHDYLRFKKLDGSYVYKDKGLHKIPVNGSEVMFSSLISGVFRKKSFHDLLSAINSHFIINHQFPPGITENTPMREVYDKYNIDKPNQMLIGHVLASHQDEDYLDMPCLETFERIKIYRNSLAFTITSPFVYPEYGVGELPEAFSRASAIYGATFKLNSVVEDFQFHPDGKIKSIQIDGDVINTKYVIADPSYFPDRVKSINKKVRCICIFDHPVNQIKNVNSAQIIIPASELNRKSDVYIAISSSSMMSAPKGMYVAIVTSNNECNDPYDDVKFGVELLSPLVEKFCWVSDIEIPKDDGSASNIFISSSYDASTLFDPIISQVKDIWLKITGKKFDIEFIEKKTSENKKRQ